MLYFQSICFLSFHPTSLSALSAHFVIYLCTYEHEQKENFIIKERRISVERRKWSQDTEMTVLFLYTRKETPKGEKRQTSGKASKESGSCAFACKHNLLQYQIPRDLNLFYLPIMFFKLRKHLVELLVGHQRLCIESLQKSV